MIDRGSTAVCFQRREVICSKKLNVIGTLRTLCLIWSWLFREIHSLEDTKMSSWTFCFFSRCSDPTHVEEGNISRSNRSKSSFRRPFLCCDFLFEGMQENANLPPPQRLHSLARVVKFGLWMTIIVRSSFRFDALFQYAVISLKNCPKRKIDDILALSSYVKTEEWAAYKWVNQRSWLFSTTAVRWPHLCTFLRSDRYYSVRALNFEHPIVITCFANFRRSFAHRVEKYQVWDPVLVQLTRDDFARWLRYRLGSQFSLRTAIDVRWPIEPNMACNADRKHPKSLKPQKTHIPLHFVHHSSVSGPVSHGFKVLFGTLVHSYVSVVNNPQELLWNLFRTFTKWS